MGAFGVGGGLLRAQADAIRRAASRWEIHRAEEAAAWGASAGESTGPLGHLASLALSGRLDAEERLIEALLLPGHDPASDHPWDPARRVWPGRGAIVGGVAYLALPEDPDELAMHGPGWRDRDRPDLWRMRLYAVPVGSILDLDGRG